MNRKNVPTNHRTQKITINQISESCRLGVFIDQVPKKQKSCP